MPDLPEAPPEAYTTRYYLESCGGHEAFLSSGGRAPDPTREFALELLALRAGEAVLDVGCGRGELVLALAELAADATGIDFSPAAIALAHQACVAAGRDDARDRFRVMDARKLAFGDRSFDAVVLTDVVEHVAPEGLRQVLAEVRRVLRPGGKLVIHTLPTRNYLRVGQHAKRIKQVLAREPVAAVVTLASEAEHARHCNIQSRRSLSGYLRAFDGVRVWYRPTTTGGPLKGLSRRLGLDAWLCPHLWAIALRPVDAEPTGPGAASGERPRTG